MTLIKPFLTDEIMLCIYRLYFLLIGCHSVTLKRLAAMIWAQLC